MTDIKRITLSSLAAATLLASGAGTALAADYPVTDTAEVEATTATSSVDDATAIQRASNPRPVEGTFTWDQSTITSNERISQMFSKAVAHLCGSVADLAQDNPLQWRLAVSGDVANAFTATVDEMAAEDSVQDTMSCTCGANPTDGGATITAEVKGIPVTYLIERAEACDGANAITFISSDGTETMMPLGYVIGRHAVISYEVNGEDLFASVGGNNQLWMTRTPAGYFVRDIVEVRITKEEATPAIPGEGHTYPNSPNVGITTASVA